jgi:hypothetical protein
LVRSGVSEVTTINAAERTRLFSLIERNTSLSIYSQFLKSKDVPHSAGRWEDAFEKRTIPAMREGKITRNDLISLLREIEEYGRQHVFLYKTSKTRALELTNANYIRQQLKRIDREDLMDQPPVLDQPNQLTLADVRVEPIHGGNRVVVKAVETRRYRKFISEERDGNRITRTYEEMEERAINVVRLLPNGLLELRIQTHTGSEYANQVADFWSLINHLLPQLTFQSQSVSPAKQFLWTNRKGLAAKIRYSDSRLRNGKGTVLSAATGTVQASLYDDVKAAESLDTFLEGDAICDKTNVFWLKGANGTPSKDIHVLLDGGINEFVVTAICTRPDYQYVFDEINKANS